MTPGSIEGRQERAKKGSPWCQRKGDQEQKGKWRAKKAVTRSKEGGNLGPHQVAGKSSGRTSNQEQERGRREQESGNQGGE